MQKPGAPHIEADKRSQYVGVVMTDQLVIQHLKHCRDLTRNFAYRVFTEFWRQWCRQVLEDAESAKTNKEQLALYEVQNLLVAVQEPAGKEFVQHLANGFVKFKNKTLNTLTGEERFSGDILSLVEHSDLEETIAITSITHRADNFLAEPLWAMQQRLALLNGGEKIEEPSNPVSPVQFCEALRKVLISVEVDLKTKIVGYKAFDQDVIAKLHELYQELNDYLIRQNLLPNLRFVPGGDSGRSAAAPAGAPDQLDAAAGDSLEPSTEDEAKNAQEFQRRASDKLLRGELNPSDVQYQNSLFSAIRLLQAHVTHQAPLPAAQFVNVEGVQSTASNLQQAARTIAASAAGSHSTLQPYTQTQLVDVLAQMQDKALHRTQVVFAASPVAGVAFNPQTVADVNREMMAQIASESDDGAVEAGDMQTIDLVGMLFEYMLSDEHLPDAVKALLSYMHTPFLKIAFIDKGFFEQPEHPARVLLNSFAEAGVRWVGNDGNDQHDIFLKIKTSVFRLLQEFKNDVRLFAELLIEFNGYTNNVARRQDLMERRALEKAQGEERLREAKIQVNNEVRSRTDGREMPSAVLLLLLQPWSDYLSFVILRYGEKSESWKNALKVIDDLLWSFEPKNSAQDKTRLMELQDDLQLALERGFETIGYEQTKGRKLLEAVIALQRMALQSRKAEAAPAPMRSKLETLAAEKAGNAKEDIENITPEETKIVDSLKMVEFGTWFEFEGGKRLKVAWYNKKTEHYMLVDQQGRKVSLAGGLQLARDMLAGKARIIAGSTKPFFERALENIYHTLSDRSKSRKAGAA